jgi:hypothetical protein
MVATPRDQIPVIVISLERAVARRQATARALEAQGVDFSFFAAIDGGRMSDQDRAALRLGPCLRDYGRALSAGEIGCAASYLAVLRQIADGSDPYACVLEDDAEPGPSLPSALSRRWLDTLPAFDFLRLVSQAHRWHKSAYLPVATLGPHQVVAPVHIGYLATGQIVTRDGARRALAKLVRIDAPIDNLIYRDPVTPLRILETRPGVISLEHGESQMTARDALLVRARAERSLIAIARRATVMTSTRLTNWVNFLRHWGVRSVVGLRRGGHRSAAR